MTVFFFFFARLHGRLSQSQTESALSASVWLQQSSLYERYTTLL